MGATRMNGYASTALRDSSTTVIARSYDWKSRSMPAAA
jgi:hypothetical protein